MPTKVTPIEEVSKDPETGALHFKLRPRTINDDGTIQVHPPHRFSVAPGEDPDLYIDAVNQHFSVGVVDHGGIIRQYAAITPQNAAAIRSTVNSTHTPPVIAAYRALRAAADEAENGGGGGSIRGNGKRT